MTKNNSFKNHRINIYQKLTKDSDRFVCIRDMYQKIDPKHCQDVEIDDLLQEQIDDSGKITEPINKLYLDSSIQYATSSW